MENIDRNQFARGWRHPFGRQFVTHETGSGKSITASKPLFDDSLAYTETGTTIAVPPKKHFPAHIVVHPSPRPSLGAPTLVQAYHH